MIDILTIHTLDVWCGPEHMERLMVRLIRRLCSSLEDLTIQFPGITEWGMLFLIYLVIMNDHPDGSSTKDTIDLKCNPNIQRLTVHTRILPNVHHISTAGFWVESLVC